MLYCMANRPGQVLSKAQLYEAAWGEEYLHGTNSVEEYHLAAAEKAGGGSQASDIHQDGGGDGL